MSNIVNLFPEKLLPELRGICMRYAGDSTELVEVIRNRTIPLIPTKWDRLKHMLYQEPILVHCENKYGKTPLFAAVEQVQPQIVQLLIERGAEVNHQDQLGETPLHEALKGSNFHEDRKIEVISLLIENGADATLQDGFGRSAQTFAANRANELWLLRKGARYELPSYAKIREALALFPEERKVNP